MPAQPKNWPQHLPYHPLPIRSKGLTPRQVETLTQKRPGEPFLAADQTPVPSPLVKITSIDDPSHPACGQHGLFATRHLKPGSFILLYVGTVHASSGPDVEESDYDLWLDRDAGLAIDAAKGGNEARFINDYRGVAERPNAEFREVWSQRAGQRCMAVFVLPVGSGPNAKSAPTRRGIAKGQEILVSYGKGFWGHR
ncbi:hypothetical protein SODALDRAFT_327525 [Sodiomyces alkalinus F11]|uniref:SET domain-containing protein n=1 Tax=Sodiomyces alkalinus (strain CBS 110278 / VKM F-3762 / F11) TaxID=1314773 RepID=A0A3N2Q9B2_SODAK|nr:hypothetical protein SODALDRAFT_327525 [Sodiomyces alkalinus F11]ROT43332.1 hypothetical protein SODALDRAFT_327525 [Sodiomyces alkalinus F11]